MRVDFKETSKGGVCFFGEEGKVIPCRGAEDGTASGARTPEAESIRRRAESTGLCVKFKLHVLFTVRETHHFRLKKD